MYNVVINNVLPSLHGICPCSLLCHTSNEMEMEPYNVALCLGVCVEHKLIVLPRNGGLFLDLLQCLLKEFEGVINHKAVIADIMGVVTFLSGKLFLVLVAQTML